MLVPATPLVIVPFPAADEIPATVSLLPFMSSVVPVAENSTSEAFGMTSLVPSRSVPAWMSVLSV